MTDKSDLHTKAMDFLLKTSRTFFIPISYLPKGLQEAIGAAYLCMRAIDEIEDHPGLPADIKVSLLQALSELLDADFREEESSIVI